MQLLIMSQIRIKRLSWWEERARRIRRCSPRSMPLSGLVDPRCKMISRNWNFQTGNQSVWSTLLHRGTLKKKFSHMMMKYCMNMARNTQYDILIMATEITYSWAIADTKKISRELRPWGKFWYQWRLRAWSWGCTCGGQTSCAPGGSTASSIHPYLCSSTTLYRIGGQRSR